jgi:cysteine synthase B
LVAISTAAVVVAGGLIAPEEAAWGRIAVIVTVLPDSADKFVGERFREEA